LSFTVTVLGTSGRFQTLERACVGYLLQIEEESIWLDAGGGTWRNLQQSIDYPDLTGVILTHGHPDHTIDVLQAYHARQYGQEDPLDSIPLWAPQETLDRLSGFAKGIDESFDLKDISSEDVLTIAGARTTFVDMAHPEPTLGVRVERDGAAVAFSSDTGEAADFETLAGGVDLFVCEATSQDSDVLWEGHLRASQAGAIAARIGVKKLVLTHLPNRRDLAVSLDEARAGAGDTDIDIELAADGMRLEIG
jgi:ribonuclease BN (tRNA processing enzyme)